jgi:hypothetical protein
MTAITSFKSYTVDQIATLSAPPQIKTANSAAVKSLTADQIKAFSPDQIAAFGDDRQRATTASVITGLQRRRSCRLSRPTRPSSAWPPGRSTPSQRQPAASR